MKTNSKKGLHTQGEWKIIKHFISLPFIGVQNDKLNVTIAIVQNDEGNEIAQANAELIVKAVNEHEILKATVAHYQKSTKELYAERQKLLDSNRKLIEILQFAIDEFDQEKAAYKFLSNGDEIDEPEMITKARKAINNAKNI